MKKIPYSTSEAQVLRLLKAQPCSSQDLCRKFYHNTVPFNGRQIIIGHLDRLSRKVLLNREPFRIRKSPRSGPIPMSFWREDTRSRRTS